MFAVNGNTVSQNVHMLSAEEICQWVGHLKNRSGRDIVMFNKMWHTDNPSIQGIWTPWTNKDTSLNLQEFPCKELSRYCDPEPPSATEILLERARQLRLGNVTLKDTDTNTEGYSVDPDDFQLEKQSASQN